MEFSSFTIEFPPHLRWYKVQHCLDQLSDTGASVEPQSQHVFRVLCSKPKQLQYVGWMLFQTHFSAMCHVISTTGEAQARHPPRRN